ncbi:MAG: hypothetical protein GX444_11735 [Myxococcales bacterium]|nr:hypothetical protein [Myxococcales bacterium]
MARKIGWIAFLGLVVLFMAWLRVYFDGRQAFHRAEELSRAGRADEAIGFYDRALHMYWPGSPHTAGAVAALTRLAGEREASGDREGALHAWRILRSGLYAERGLYQPYAAIIARSEEHIAALVALLTGDETMKQSHLALLRQNEDPARGWSMLALAGFACWVGAGFGFIWRALAPAGKIKARPAFAWGALFVAGYGLWLLGLYLA